MDISVVGLLLLSALMHACWNLLAKRSIDKQAFLWLALVVEEVVLLVPFLLLVGPVPPEGWYLILLSGTLEAIYFLLLGSAYQRGDLSLVYPLARGSAPLYVILFAYIFLGERVFWAGIVGIMLVVAGIYSLHLKSLDARGLFAPFLSLRRRPSQLALLTGLTIGTYSVVDKAGVSYVSPVPYLYMVLMVSLVVLLPYMLWAKRQAIVIEWGQAKVNIVAVAVLSTGGFLLVLYALTVSKVSYVAPVREISVVFGAILGATLLREPFARTKIIGSTLIFLGVLFISLAR